MRVGPEPVEQIELRAARGFGAVVGEVDDHALRRPVDRAVRLVDEALQALREPVIAPRLPGIAVHALLHHGPLAVVGHDEAVQVKIEAVLHGGAVHLGDEPARACERRAVDAGALADRDQLLRRLARMPPAPAAHMDAELGLQRREAALERAEHARRDAGGMPVHSHHGAERLKPERMREPAQQFVAPVVMHDRLRDHGAEPRHALAQPGRHAPAMQRQVGASGPAGHGIFILRTIRIPYVVET